MLLKALLGPTSAVEGEYMDRDPTVIRSLYPSFTNTRVLVQSH